MARPLRIQYPRAVYRVMARANVDKCFYHADGNVNVTCLIFPNQQIAAKYLYDPFGNMLAMIGLLAGANK